MQDSFFIVVYDHSNRTFNVYGPLTDDTDINKKVCDAREGGQDVTCQSTKYWSLSREGIIQKVTSETGHQHADDPIV